MGLFRFHFLSKLADAAEMSNSRRGHPVQLFEMISGHPIEHVTAICRQVLMAAAKDPRANGIVYGKAIVRIIIRIHHQLARTIEEGMTVLA